MHEDSFHQLFLACVSQEKRIRQRDKCGGLLHVLFIIHVCLSVFFSIFMLSSTFRSSATSSSRISNLNLGRSVCLSL